jgi:hypothetical protein
MTLSAIAVTHPFKVLHGSLTTCFEQLHTCSPAIAVCNCSIALGKHRVKPRTHAQDVSTKKFLLVSAIFRGIHVPKRAPKWKLWAKNVCKYALEPRLPVLIAWRTTANTLTKHRGH